MYSIKNELLNCADKLKIGIRVLEKNQTENVMDLFKSRFINEQSTENVFLWEKLTDTVYLNDPMGWSYIGDFVGDTPCLIMFNDLGSWVIMEIGSGSDLTELLGESCGFEFYVMDRELSYAVCFTHEDQLLCVGKAKEWLNNFQR